MTTFHCAGDLNITRGNFSVVHGNQIINYNSHDVYFERSNGRNSIRFQPGEEWKEMLYQEYERVPIGRIKLTRTLCYAPLVAQRRRYITTSSGEEDHLEAERVIEIASTINGREESLPSLSIRYAGRDAKELFKQDCIHFSRQRTTIIPQLRAFNDSDIPIIIFNEELVSIRHFLEHNLYSVQALTYLGFQIHSNNLLLGTSDELRAWLLSASEEGDLKHLLWFRPQTGALCFGPPGPHPERHPNDNLPFWINRSAVEHSSGSALLARSKPSLPLNACNNAIFLDWIMHNLHETEALYSMCSSAVQRTSGPAHRGTCRWKEHLLTEECTAWKDCSRRVLKIPFSDGWYYDTFPTLRASKATEKGGMRFLLMGEFPNLPGFAVEEEGGTDTQPFSREERWLSQAGWFFSSMRVPRAEWSSYGLHLFPIAMPFGDRFLTWQTAIITGVTLQLSTDEKYNCWYKNLGSPCYPCYLFVLPAPQLSNSVPDIETWLRGENLYYYSYDPEGGSVITEEERIALGLFSFTSEVCIEYAYWDAGAYDFMEQWQNAKGFDYATRDYAESLGMSILEIDPQDKRRLDDVMGFQVDGEGKDLTLSIYELLDSPMELDSDFPSMRSGDDAPLSSSDVDMDVDNW
ncbi:hypothetical protein AAF712_016576 [Marasmius tenuissimus]|uniref:Uncharacterized protein n=1 Tax=Marasmius tenuissimus TaxID=585030 RepID=A0ABR2Z6C0_9AGAR